MLLIPKYLLFYVIILLFFHLKNLKESYLENLIYILLMILFILYDVISFYHFLKLIL